MDQRRTTDRYRVVRAGTIEFGGGSIDCTVRNFSRVGAALDVASPAGIPDQFTLVVSSEGLRQPCHVIWRKEKSIGVKFD